MIKNIFYLIQTPLTDRDHKRFGIELMMSRGFEVNILDLTSLLHPEYLDKYTPANIVRSDKIVQIESPAQFATVINKINKDSSISIVIFRDAANTHFVFKALKRHDLKYALICTNNTPDVARSPEPRDIIIFIKKVIFYVLNKVMAKIKDTSAPDFLVCDGIACNFRAIFPRPNINTRTVWAHTLDYDLYLDHKKEGRPSPVGGDYAVFLDEYFPLHPDYYSHGVAKSPYADYREYYNEICLMFDRIEQKTGVQVVVAAHPRSQYEKMPDLFQGRKVLKRQSLELVAGSKFVLMHGSTSVNFAVLFNKPLIFLLPGKVLGGYYEKFIRNYAGHFGKTPYRLEDLDDLDLQAALFIGQQYYSKYMENYIKRADSPKKYFWDIVADEIVDSQGGEK